MPPVLAAQGGPNFSTGPVPGTAFPGLQTVLYWAEITNADDIAPDAAANAAGAKVTADGTRLHVDVPTWQTSIELVEWGHASLDWTRVSYWNIDDWWGGGGTNRSVFVFGYETPAGSVPASGTATYGGLAEGSAFYPENQGAGEVRLTGNAAFTADFGARSVTGSLTGMTANGAPWNSVAFNSTITGNAFSGTTSVTSAPGGIASLASNAAGTLEGKFFGPSAQEAGAVWTLFDGTKAAIGTLSGKR
ncbi:MAG TPA: transferrin-binding protein-like solute binding protein [Sphingomicrobium sp.]|nr:transferrin-binding protein-like solute binding protein [Sphingomicrobium sp.]